MSRAFLASASPSVGLSFTTRRPWFVDRTSGAVMLKGELGVLDLRFTATGTTNHLFNDEGSCWASMVRAADYEDHDCGLYVLAAEDTRVNGRFQGYVWGNEVPATVVNIDAGAEDPTPVGRPVAAPLAAAAPYSQDMRYGYVATFQNDSTVVAASPHSSGNKYNNCSRYIGLLGEPMAQSSTSMVRIAFDGWAGFSLAGVI